MFGLTTCDTTAPDASSLQETVTPEQSTSKSSRITIDGPQQVAPEQECTWPGAYTESHSSIDWYRDFQ